MFRLGVILISCAVLFCATTSQAISITQFYGDIDGFGFGLGLVPGQILPDLDNNGSLEPCPPGQGNCDEFDNRDAGEILNAPNTDIGISIEAMLEFDFEFAVPAGHNVIGAQFSIVGADFSNGNQLIHQIFVDGQTTGEILTPLSTDGEITFTSITISALLLNPNANSFTIGLDFSLGGDDFAIDYANLTIETALVPEPNTGMLLALGLGGLAVRRSRPLS